MPGSEIPDGGSNQLSRNERFLQSLNRNIESNLSNDQFGAENLAESLNISRTQLFRRLQKLTGKNISQYIREYRLKKALELLKKDVASASEIAYQVGFSSPSYFNKCFHDFYGYTPGSITHLNLEEEKSHKIISIIKSNSSEDQQLKHIETPGISKQKDNNVISSYVEIISKSSLLSKIKIIYALLGIGIIIIIAVFNWKFLPDKDVTEMTVKDVKSVAVLVFENLSNDPDQEYFNEAIAENIRNRLSNLSNLRVISMTSSKQYKSSDLSLKQIGKELDVDYIIEGSVFKVDKNIRIIVQLIESKSDVQVWTESYDRELSDILNLQNEIAYHITKELNVELLEHEYLTLHTIRKINPELYSDYLLANHLLSLFIDKNDSSYNQQTISLLNQIIYKEPTFIEAYITLAFALENIKYYNLKLYESVSSDSIINIVNKAIQINPSYSGSYSFLAQYYGAKNEMEKERKNLLKVIELDPNNFSAVFRLGNVLLQERNFEYAIINLIKAIKIKPINRHSEYEGMFRMYNIGYAFLQFQLIDEGYLVFEKMIELYGEGTCLTHAYQLLAGKFRDQGNYKEYVNYYKLYYKCDTTDFLKINHLAEAYMVSEQYEKAEYFFKLSSSQSRIRPNTDTSFFYPHLAFVLRQLGRNDEADCYLDKFMELNKFHYNKDQWKIYNMAEAYALLGENKEAMKLLRSLPYETGINYLIPIDPLLISLKDDEEYQELVNLLIKEREDLSNLMISKNVQREIDWLMEGWDLSK